MLSVASWCCLVSFAKLKRMNSVDILLMHYNLDSQKLSPKDKLRQGGYQRGTSRFQTLNDEKVSEVQQIKKLETSGSKDCSKIEVHAFHKWASMTDIYFSIMSRE